MKLLLTIAATLALTTALTLKVSQPYSSSVGEGMYLTDCPLRGPGHDSSVEE